MGLAIVCTRHRHVQGVLDLCLQLVACLPARLRKGLDLNVSSQCFTSSRKSFEARQIKTGYACAPLHTNTNGTFYANNNDNIQ